tara:strand:+ start:11306 stop:11956 length:651 start_codon:yes stop_codon:yes gene_type:complete
MRIPRARLFTATIALSLLGGLSACEKLKESASSNSFDNPAISVDVAMLESPSEIAKVHEEIVRALGANADVAYKVSVGVKRQYRNHPERPPRLDIDLQYQDPNNEHQLQVRSWDSAYAEWSSNAAKIEVKGRNAESFRLASELFDMRSVTAAFLQEAVKTGTTKYMGNKKYSEQYLSSIDIDSKGATINFEGVLAANGQEKRNRYHASLPARQQAD